MILVIRNCDHSFAVYLTIASASILGDSCQYVAYECRNYHAFKNGECADCGTNKNKCALYSVWGPIDPLTNKLYAKIEAKTSEWEKRDRRLYIEMAKNAPYCCEYYVHFFN